MRMPTRDNCDDDCYSDDCDNCDYYHDDCDCDFYHEDGHSKDEESDDAFKQLFLTQVHHKS